MSEKKLVVFDLDGTLNRTELYALPAHRKALCELGITGFSDEDILESFGMRFEDSAPRFIGSRNPEKIREYYLMVSQYEQDFIQTSARAYDGTEEALTLLRKKGYETAICSNSSETYIRMVLKALKLEHLIDHIQQLIPGLEKDGTLRLLLERTSPPAGVMVGDRIFDKLAARANGIPFIGCLYGFNQEEVADGDAAVSSPSDLPDAIDRLIG